MRKETEVIVDSSIQQAKGLAPGIVAEGFNPRN
jgi:hypothetical protein